jgi:hypothetical protein
MYFTSITQEMVQVNTDILAIGAQLAAPTLSFPSLRPGQLILHPIPSGLRSNTTDDLLYGHFRPFFRVEYDAHSFTETPHEAFYGVVRFTDMMARNVL